MFRPNDVSIADPDIEGVAKPKIKAVADPDVDVYPDLNDADVLCSDPTIKVLPIPRH